ncbi:MAG TPA: ribonucleotide reductase N-terminal alpha domain-containing protein, partial [Methanomicrobiales archaeon]|nr:ribonucleotide reductase N-terminal alpha domain-containing protein [Methanomicrobiales archaeon]
MNLTSTALHLLKSRYLLPGESPLDLFKRVVDAVDTDKKHDFLSLFENLLFLPNSPTLMNAGTRLGQLSACFVLPIE